VKAVPGDQAVAHLEASEWVSGQTRRQQHSIVAAVHGSSLGKRPTEWLLVLQPAKANPQFPPFSH